MQIEKLWQRCGLLLLIGAALGLAAPAAMARDHDRGYQPSRSSYGYRYQRPVRYAPPRAYGHGYGYARPSRYAYRGSYGYAPRYYGGYGYPRYHDHWGVGEVIGAMVVGSILTNAIDAAMQPPRTRVIERRVVSGPYYPDDAAPPTRYLGPDTGYYDRQ